MSFMLNSTVDACTSTTTGLARNQLRGLMMVDRVPGDFCTVQKRTPARLFDVDDYDDTLVHGLSKRFA